MKVDSTQKTAAVQANPGPQASSSVVATERADTQVLHQSKGNDKTISFAHLKGYFNNDGQLVGKTSIRESNGQEVEAEVLRETTEDNSEVYKLKVNDEVIAFNEVEFNGSVVKGQFIAAKYPGKYKGILDQMYQIRLERMQELGKETDTELIVSYNSGDKYLERGFELQDRTGLDTESGKKADAFIEEKISEAGSAEAAHTEELGCTNVFLPRAGIRKFKKMIKKNPIFEENNFASGKVTLCEADGNEVEAQVSREQDSNTGIDVYKISVDGEEVANIQLNYMKLNDDGQVEDYCGSYTKDSPFSQYGNGWKILGGRKPKSKVFVEVNESLTEKYTDLEEKLFQIPAEIAQKDSDFEGRVAMEADWNEHAAMHELGFRTQTYRGIKEADKLKEAFEDEIEKAKQENRRPNTKNFGSQKMRMSFDELKAKYGSKPKILSA